MRRLKRPQRDVRVSLFPFLAVLLCTMGALIVLLVLITGLTRMQAKLDEEPEPEPEPPPMEEPVRDDTLAQRKAQLARMQQQLESLLAARQKSLAEVDRGRAALASAEMEFTRRKARRDELDRLASQLDLNNRPPADVDALQEKLAELEQLEESKRKELDEKKKRAKTKHKSSYAIIPYQGPYQTRRRPIYIECRSNSIVLQPEGIVFTEVDFLGPSGPGNPLARAVRAASEQILRGQNAANGEAGTPYPLLIVRPDGIGSYYAARSAIKSWGSEFGYELVEQDWELDYQPANESIKVAAQRAADDARQRLRQLAAAAPGLFSNGGASRTFRVSRQGVVADGGVPGGNQSPFRPFAGMLGSEPGAPGGPGTSGAHAGAGGQFAGAPGSNPYGTGQPGQQPGQPGQPTRYGDLSDKQPGQPGNTSGNPNQPNAPAGGSSQTRVPGQNSSGQRSSQQASSGGAAGPGQGGQSGQQGNGSAGSGTSMPSLASVRGTNWALPDVAAGSIGVRREVRIDCADDRLVLMPENRVIPLDRQTADIVDELVTILWEKINGWGIAGNGMYWKPSLVFHVDATGDKRYHELAQLLRNSGMDVRGVRKQAR